MGNQFSASTAEMDRRKTAFQALCASIVFSMTVMGFILFPADLPAAMFTVLLIGLLLVMAILYFDRLLEVSKRGLVTVRAEEIEHVHARFTTRHPVASIKSIIVKRTVHGNIREIRCVTDASGSFFINGLDDFDSFFKCLSDVVGKEVPIATIREPMDFDHRMFYPLLGIVVGAASTLFLKSVLSWSTGSYAVFQSAVGAFLAALGVYWLISKPLVGRYGNKSLRSDMFAGFALVATGVVLALDSGFMF